MNTGETFSDVGRDGLFNAAEAPSGQHGRHAMLIVGYYRQLLYREEFVGRGLGRQGILLHPQERFWRNRSRI